jgi:galactokinase
MNKRILQYIQQYRQADFRFVKSPLRICPLGAHVDHQHGIVTGMAINESITLAYFPNEKGYMRLQSLDFPDEEYFHIDHVPAMIPGFWGNYIRGAVLSLSRYYKISIGITAFVSGRLPIGGLSSSAAATTAYLLALCDVNHLAISKEELIEHSHWVEKHFIGLQNGILDQAANILSVKDQLMVLDCKTGKYELVEGSDTASYEIAVLYSGVSKALIATDYNRRVEECKVAAWLLQEMAGAPLTDLRDVTLRDIDLSAYKAYKDRLPGRFARRAEHFFSECERVASGVRAWSQGDLEEFGRLMWESGRSSIEHYECGCPELITLYRLLKECPGVYGARFSGAGYRGCCIAIVDPKYKQEIASRIDHEYPLRHPQHKDHYKIYFCKPDNGARLVNKKDIEEGLSI